MSLCDFRSSPVSVNRKMAGCNTRAQDKHKQRSWEDIVAEEERRKARRKSVQEEVDAKSDESGEPSGEEGSEPENTGPATRQKTTPDKNGPVTPHKTPAKRGRGRPPKKGRGRKVSASGGKKVKPSEKPEAQPNADAEIKYLNQCLIAEGRKLASKDKKIKELKSLLRQEKAERKRLESIIDTTEPDSDSEEMSKLKSKLTEKTELVEKLEKISGEKNEMIKELRQESEEKDGKIAQLRETLAEQQETSKKIVDKFVNVKAKELKDHVVWVIDSAHETEIRAKLTKDTEWDLFPVSSVASLNELEKTDKFNRAVGKASVVIVMLGSSDLLPDSKCESTSSIYSYLSAFCEKIKKRKVVAVVTVPPTKISGTLSEVPFLNTMISQMKPECLVIDCQEQFNSLPKRLTIAENGISVSDRGAEIAINAVAHMLRNDLKTHRAKNPRDESSADHGDSEMVNKENDRPIPNANQRTGNHVLVEVPSRFMKHVVGKGKRGLERISRESMTALEIYKFQEDNIQKEAVKITGNETNCRKAVELIHQIIRDQKSKEGQIDYNQECSFYRDGKCDRESSCPFRHSDGQSRAKMIRLN